MLSYFLFCCCDEILWQKQAVRERLVLAQGSRCSPSWQWSAGRQQGLVAVTHNMSSIRTEQWMNPCALRLSLLSPSYITQHFPDQGMGLPRVIPMCQTSFSLHPFTKWNAAKLHRVIATRSFFFLTDEQYPIVQLYCVVYKVWKLWIHPLKHSHPMLSKNINFISFR